MSDFNQAEYVNGYHRDKLKQVKFNLNKKYDAELIAYLETIDNKQGFLKSLIETDLRVKYERGEKILKDLEAHNVHRVQYDILMERAHEKGLSRYTDDLVLDELKFQVESMATSADYERAVDYVDNPQDYRGKRSFFKPEQWAIDDVRTHRKYYKKYIK